MTERRDELIELVSDLVRIDARNPWLIAGGAGEAAIAADLADRARAIPGAEVRVVDVRPGRPNVLVRLPGGGGGSSLCLNAHIDTVGDASWPDRSMTPVADGDHLVGLGAADDKGHCAAVLLAMADLARRPVPLLGDVVAAFVMDEEATSLGTEALVRDETYDGAIVVEPFGLGRAIVTHQGLRAGSTSQSMAAPPMARRPMSGSTRSHDSPASSIGSMSLGEDGRPSHIR